MHCDGNDDNSAFALVLVRKCKATLADLRHKLPRLLRYSCMLLCT